MYPEIMVIPMREELTRAGIKEARTAEEVDAALAKPGTTMLVVNSICGCAAGKMRPGVRMALQNKSLPDQAITVFAGWQFDVHVRQSFRIDAIRNYGQVPLVDTVNGPKMVGDAFAGANDQAGISSGEDSKHLRLQVAKNAEPIKGRQALPRYYQRDGQGSGHHRRYLEIVLHHAYDEDRAGRSQPGYTASR